VIVLGHVDDKGVLHARRIDLRLPSNLLEISATARGA